MAGRLQLDRLGQQLLRRHIGNNGGEAEEQEELLLDALHRQLALAKAENEQEIICVLKSQIAELSKPPQVNRVYHIRLASNHFHSKAGSYLDAHRLVKRDILDEHTSYLSAHVDGDVSSSSAQWLLTTVDEGILSPDLQDAIKKVKRKGAECFHIQMVGTVRNKQARGVYICAVPSYECTRNPYLCGRNDYSSFVFVQPLWANSTDAASVWTSEPVPLGDGEDFARCSGFYKLRLVCPSSPVRLYLESHRSRPGDIRSSNSSFVNLHEEQSACSGHFAFEEQQSLQISKEPMKESSPSRGARHQVSAGAVFFGGGDGDGEDEGFTHAMLGRRDYRDSLESAAETASCQIQDSDEAEGSPRRHESPFQRRFGKFKEVTRLTVQRAGNAARDVAREVKHHHRHNDEDMRYRDIQNVGSV